MILLVTSPFTQLNTPYPATAYLKGFLHTRNIPSFQVDLGLDVILSIFSKEGLKWCFQKAHQIESDNARRIFQLQDAYCAFIDDVIHFLQGKNPTLGFYFSEWNSLPHASRFNQVADELHTFGTMGIQDKAKYYCTLFLEDISDFIQECVDPHFGFSRYAEQLARCANSFDELYISLQAKTTYLEEIMFSELDVYIQEKKPDLIAFSVPFPGNLFSTLRCARYIKQHNASIKIAMGGGFVNTELRSLQEPRIFEFVDFITLDDGEAPIELIWQHLKQHLPVALLKRTYMLHELNVAYFNESIQRDYKQHETGTPDYTDLKLDRYISVVEMANPMNRLWSDGRWNKLTMAHGCYWGKCTFCDVHLPYIGNYEPVQAKLLVDRMQELMEKTGSNGFHFVDEAAPPALMKELAIEIIKRKLNVSWWTNIRFEKSFTEDLCYLLQTSGCIGVSGGLEVASDRLLLLIEKGVTIEQVTRVLCNFKQAGIMVHAYLMYAYPTQTDQETIDSLEVVRQLFHTGILQSAFWHRFALTVHSPIARNPEKYQIQIDPESKGSFANNDLRYREKVNIDHDKFSFGLKKSLFNYMQGIGLDQGVHTWFEFKVPLTTIDVSRIENIIQAEMLPAFKDTHRVLSWIYAVTGSSFVKSKKGKQWNMMTLTIHTKLMILQLVINEEQGAWFKSVFQPESDTFIKEVKFGALRNSFEEELPQEDFDLLWYNKIYPVLKGKAIVIV